MYSYPHTQSLLFVYVLFIYYFYIFTLCGFLLIPCHFGFFFNCTKTTNQKFHQFKWIFELFFKLSLPGCLTITIIQLQSIFITPVRSSCPFAVISHSYLQALATTTLLSSSVDLPFVDIPCRRNHIEYGLLHQTSFIQHNLFKNHPCCMQPISVPHQYLFYC